MLPPGIRYRRRAVRIYRVLLIYEGNRDASLAFRDSFSLVPTRHDATPDSARVPTPIAEIKKRSVHDKRASKSAKETFNEITYTDVSRHIPFSSRSDLIEAAVCVAQFYIRSADCVVFHILLIQILTKNLLLVYKVD